MKNKIYRKFFLSYSRSINNFKTQNFLKVPESEIHMKYFGYSANLASRNTIPEILNCLKYLLKEI